MFTANTGTDTRTRAQNLASLLGCPRPSSSTELPKDCCTVILDINTVNPIAGELAILLRTDIKKVLVSSYIPEKLGRLADLTFGIPQDGHFGYFPVAEWMKEGKRLRSKSHNGRWAIVSNSSANNPKFWDYVKGLCENDQLGWLPTTLGGDTFQKEIFKYRGIVTTASQTAIECLYMGLEIKTIPLSVEQEQIHKGIAEGCAFPENKNSEMAQKIHRLRRRR